MDWIAYMKDNEARIAALFERTPLTAKGFTTMGQGAKRDGALSEKSKEFVAVGIAVATKCKGCIGFHTRSLVRLGATREELAEAVAMAAYMGGGGSVTYGAMALEAFDQFAAANG